MRSRSTFACVLLLALAACASKPTMHLDHAELNGVSLGFPPQLGIMMTVVVNVYNPNSYDVAVRAMRGQCTMAGRYPLPIDFRPGGEGVWLPSEQTTQVRVPINVPVQLALQMLHEAYMQPTIPFRVSGSADVTATRTFKIEKDDYSVDEQGLISRQQILGALPPELRVGL